MVVEIRASVAARSGFAGFSASVALLTAFAAAMIASACA